MLFLSTVWVMCVNVSEKAKEEEVQEKLFHTKARTHKFTDLLLVRMLCFSGGENEPGKSFIETAVSRRHRLRAITFAVYCGAKCDPLLVVSCRMKLLLLQRRSR